MRQKILVIGPCLAMGGMERASANTANGLSQKSEVVFVSLFKKPHFFQLNPGIHLEEPDNFNSSSLSLFKTVKWIRKLVKTHKPDSVLVFNKFYSALTAFALIGNSVPFFISERSSPLYVWKQPFRLINWLAFTLRAPQGVIAQTSIAAQYQRKYYKKSKVKVIPNIVREVQLFPAIPREKFILAVGRFNDALKGFDRLLEAIAITKTDWPLYLAGGENRSDPKLDTLIETCALKERIHFLGKVTDMDPLFSRAGLFVIPSRSEGFPNALVEAMAAGLPCISFDFVSGPQDRSEEGINGILVPDGNIQKLADAIDRLILDENLQIQLGKNALAARENYKAETITKEIEQFILSNINE